MTPEAQRIAIAETCGWRKEYADVPTWNAEINDYQGGYENKHTLIMRRKEKAVRAENLPNYLSDLNAMHEAEKVLTDEQWSIYLSFLTKKDQKTLTQTWRPAVSATAAQRAEAFLKTLNLWKPL